MAAYIPITENSLVLLLKQTLLINKKAVFPAENGDFEIWLPSTDSNRGLDG